MLRATSRILVQAAQRVQRGVGAAASGHMATAAEGIRTFTLFYAPPPHPTHSQPVVEKLKAIAPEKKPLFHTKTAQEFIAEVPIIEVDGNVAICDGGDGALGHPREYIQLNKSKQNTPETCKYCGLRYRKKADAHHH